MADLVRKSREFQPSGYQPEPKVNGPQRATPDMKNEIARLGSFSQVALPLAVSSITLARKGFYFNQNLGKIICVYCRIPFDVPSSMNVLFSEHRKRAPRCLPIKEEETAGNLGHYILSQVPQGGSGSVTKRWPAPRPSAATFQRLSSSGSEEPDEEEIDDEDLYCSGPQLSGSLPDMTQLGRYRRDQMATFVNSEEEFTTASLGECSIPISSSAVPQHHNPRERREPTGIFDDRNAKIKGFRNYEDRLASFDLWPVERRPTKEELADCGFIFIADDLCQCFTCEVILHEWKTNDDVWVEHAKNSPDCDFVLFRKGDDFVASVRAGENVSAQPLHIVERTVVTALLDTDRVRRVMEFGPFTEDEVGSVIQERLMETGEDFKNMTEMINVLESIRDKSRQPPRVQFHRTIENVGNPSAAVIPNNQETSRANPRPVEHQTSSVRRSNVNEEWQEFEGYEPLTAVASVATPSALGVHVNSSGDLRVISLENEELQDRELCSICVDRDRNTVFVPCHHLISCWECANRLNECPICRERITDRMVIINE